MRVLSKDAKAKKAQETRNHLAEAEASYTRIVEGRKELFEKVMARPEYSEETKDSLRRGYEADMSALERDHKAYVEKLRRSL